MKLRNFCVGRVQAVQINGETVNTAHVKRPSAEPWRITEQGAEGDERAVHPDKLYAFARTAYEYWGRQLRHDPAAWQDGFFGENLTVEDLDEEDIRVGDTFALGDDVRLVVSGARTPCLKLAWRLGQPRTFQRVFAASRHTGVYFDVLVPGTVKRGDELRRLRHDPAMPSIAAICDFVQSSRPPPIEPLKMALAFDRLSPVLRLLLSLKLEAAERAAALPVDHWPGWRPFVIDSIRDEAADIRSFILKSADGAPLSRPRAGQFVSVRMPDGNGAWITRTWSLSEYSESTRTYRITVHRRGGAGSQRIHASARGDIVHLRSPSGAFTLDMSGFKPVILVAAGIGITPLLAMLQAHLSRPHPPPVYLFYGARSPDHAAFREELQRLAATHPRFHLTFVYSRTGDEAQPPRRISAEWLIEQLSDLSVELGGHRVPVPWYENDTYLCGPGDFCTGLRQALAARGANADRVFSESFIAVEAAASPLPHARVRFARSGICADWHAAQDLSLLELAERAGLEPPHDCRAGACLTCRSPLLAGTTTADLGDGSALICVGRPASAELELDI